jgi:trimethylamine--corrinoid protein Co-methyltransferase
VSPIWYAYGALTNTTKPILISPENTKSSELLIEIARIAAGGKDNLRDRPNIMAGGCPQSPLMYAEGMSESIIAFAKEKLPFMVLSMAMSGGSSPVTLAGTLVTHNAEVLTGIILGQLVNPGTPVVYGSSTTAMDLKTGSASVGSPELALLSAGVAQLARMYQIPSLVAGG